MISVAVASLFAATTLAAAQGANQSGMKSDDAPATASPKTDKAVPANPAGTRRSEGMAPTPDAGKPGAAAQGMKGEPGTQKAGEMKADPKSKAATDSSTPADDKDAKTPKNPVAADGKSAAPAGKMAPEAKTTGNAATSAAAGPSAEKRTEIFSAIKHEKTEDVQNVTFNVSVGTVIPTTVSYHTLPPRIVAIYPEWRGYQYILVRGEYIIVRPETREIVYIIQG